MKLWKISSKQHLGYDCYDSAIVAALTREEAIVMSPDDGRDITTTKNDGSWVNSPAEVNIKYIGMAKRGTPKGVILASYNAG